MKSIYERALGERYRHLHPKLQEKFGLTSITQRAAISRGVMEEIAGGVSFLRPLFVLGTKKRIIFPERGRNIPFVLENYAYQDSFGRECVAWARTFHFPKQTRHFDATMIYSERKKGIVDYFGTHHDFVSDLTMEVQENGGLRIISSAQRVIRKGVTLPLPVFLQSNAVITEWYDDRIGAFFIHVRVRNSLVGTLFEYRGSFHTEYVDMPAVNIPEQIKPVREQSTE